MDLRELAAYAGEAYGMAEQHKWPEFPGISVLADRATGKWVALLMRFWDYDQGQEIQHCDIKCGQEVLWQDPAPYLSKPYRMKGPKWVGVTFGDDTDREEVCRLLDRAVEGGEGPGATIVLENKPQAQRVVYGDTPLPGVRRGFPDLADPVPAKIAQMRKLYRYGEDTFRERCENFCRQGKFMEDYEDHEPWSGDYKWYFPTYHDLNVRQLRGYFTWRVQVRRGEYPPTATSFAYLYVYELLNGIGAASPEESLEKLEAFLEGYVRSGVGEASMEENLRRWMLELAVVKGLPPEKVRFFADPQLLARDQALALLSDPQGAEPGELFHAILFFSPRKLGESPVLAQDRGRGEALFGKVWQEALARSRREGGDLFTDCFGKKRVFDWHPLANAVYWEQAPHPDACCQVDPVRVYRCRDGAWQGEEYSSVFFNRERFQGLFHEADRQLRLYCKTGRTLKKKPQEAWASPVAEAVIQADRQAVWEASRPKLTIDLGGLEKIRRDAAVTRDSLLTEEERQEALAPAPPPEAQPVEEAPGLPGLDDLSRQILHRLLRGEDPGPVLKEARLMASLAAEAINQVFLEELGDNVVECEGSALSLVEDYREDVAQMLGGGEL